MSNVAANVTVEDYDRLRNPTGWLSTALINYSLW